MDGIEEFERRIELALDRIGVALDAVNSTADVSATQKALAAEKKANAELEDRIKSLDEKIGSLEARIEDLQTSEQDARGELERLREDAASVDHAQELNRSMKSELNRLSSVREADRAELDGILGELKKLLEVKASA